MNMKKYVSIILVLSLCFALMAGCSSGTGSGSGDSGSTDSSQTGGGSDTSGGDDGKVYTMRIGAVASEPAPEAWFVLELESIIEEATGGRIDVESYPSGTIGTTTQMIQGIQDGSMEGVMVPVNYYESYVPELGVLGLPMFFKTAEQAYDFCRQDGEFNDMLDELLEAKGFEVGCWGISAASCILSNKEITSFEDLNGLKVWTLPNARITDAWNSFGAAPVNFDTGDLAVGMQQHTIDAAYTGSQLFNSLKLQEFAKYYVYPTEAINFNVQAVMLSKAWCDSLPDDLHELLIETLEKAGHEQHYTYTTEYTAGSEEEIMNTEGVTTWYTDDAFNQAVREATAHLAEDFLESTPSAQPLYDLARELIENDTEH